MTDLVVRMATESDQSALEEWVTTEPVAWVDAVRFRAELASLNYRYAWSWLAERAGRPVGRALWWGSSTSARPSTLDCLLVSPAEENPDEVATALVRAGLAHFGEGPALEFNVDVATDWAQDASAVQAIGWRERAAHAGGLTRTTERMSFARTRTDPRPDQPGRLSFRSGSDADFRALFAAVAPGSLDAHTIATVAEQGVSALADDDLEFYLSLPGRRDAWQIATIGDDDAPVGRHPDEERLRRQHQLSRSSPRAPRPRIRARAARAHGPGAPR